MPSLPGAATRRQTVAWSSLSRLAAATNCPPRATARKTRTLSQSIEGPCEVIWSVDHFGRPAAPWLKRLLPKGRSPSSRLRRKRLRHGKRRRNCAKPLWRRYSRRVWEAPSRRRGPPPPDPHSDAQLQRRKAGSDRRTGRSLLRPQRSVWLCACPPEGRPPRTEARRL